MLFRSCGVDVLTVGVAGQPALVVVVARNFELLAATNLAFIGHRAVVILGFGDVIIDGVIDVGARASIPGPGAEPSDCAAGGDGGNNGGTFSRGGGGGGSVADGGDGGDVGAIAFNHGTTVNVGDVFTARLAGG